MAGGRPRGGLRYPPLASTLPDRGTSQAAGLAGRSVRDLPQAGCISMGRAVQSEGPIHGHGRRYGCEACVWRISRASRSWGEQAWLRPRSPDRRLLKGTANGQAYPHRERSGAGPRNHAGETLMDVEDPLRHQAHSARPGGTIVRTACIGCASEESPDGTWALDRAQWTGFSEALSCGSYALLAPARG